jgi:hypothetical protein
MDRTARHPAGFEKPGSLGLPSYKMSETYFAEPGWPPDPEAGKKVY